MVTRVTAWPGACDGVPHGGFEGARRNRAGRIPALLNLTREPAKLLFSKHQTFA